MSIRIVLADDHRLMREGLASILAAAGDMEIVGEAGDGMQALEVCTKLKPDVLVADLSMPSLNGIEVADRLRTQSPRTAVLICSMYSEEKHVHEALKAGASGYILKGCSVPELLEAVRRVAAGGIHLGPEVGNIALAGYVRRARVEQAEPIDKLSDREREILRLLAESHSNAGIALLLGISPNTVNSHRRRLMKKLGCSNLVDLVRFAIRSGVSKS